jgi:hypothetical protein
MRWRDLYQVKCRSIITVVTGTVCYHRSILVSCYACYSLKYLLHELQSRLVLQQKKENDLNKILQKLRLHRPNRWGTVLDDLRNALHPGHLIIIHHCINHIPSTPPAYSPVNESQLFTNRTIIYHSLDDSRPSPKKVRLNHHA